MSVLVVPVPNLMVVKDQQGQSVGLVRNAAAVVSPAIGTTESAWEPIGITRQRDALGIYEVPSAFRNKITGAVVPNPNLSRPRIQSITEAFPNRFKPKPKPRPSRAGGVNGGAGGGAGGAGGITFAGGAPSRIDQLQQMLTTGATPGGVPIVRPSGQLTDEAQAALLAGLDLDEYTEALVAYIEPTYSVQFLIHDDGLGTVSYIDGVLQTPSSLASLNAYLPPMNFPTAHQYAELGYLIGRSGWTSDGEGPDEWLKLTDGIWYRGTEGAWVVVKGDTGAADPTLLIDDVTAIDWVVSPYPTETLPTLEQLEVMT
jgi:hypothetical protein